MREGADLLLLLLAPPLLVLLLLVGFVAEYGGTVGRVLAEEEK